MTAKKTKSPARKSATSVAAKKPATKKPSAKKPASKKASAKKPATKKPAAKKAAAKRTSAKKATAKKPVKKAATQKPATKKATAKKPVAKKAAVKKAAVKKAAATKPGAKKATAKRPAAKKATAKKPVAKKATAKKPAAKKATTKKAAAKKAVTKKRATRKKAAKTGTPKIHYGGAVLVSSKRAKAGSADANVLMRKRAVADDFSLVKTGKKKRTKSYSNKDLVHFRIALLETRERLMDQVNYLRNVSLTREDIGFSEEDGTDAFQRQVALNLAGREGDSVAAINDAVRRIDEGSYGVCEECSCLIEKGRLEALPFASLCITCKSEREKRNGGRR